MNTIAWIVRILWACRVSVVSAFGGLALFLIAVPAQNLMADLSFQSIDVVFWFGVFALTVLAWAFPVHYGARLTLNDESWIVSRALAITLRRDYRGLIQAIPRFLGVVPFVALGVGIVLGAWANAGAKALPEGRATITQAWWLGGADLLVALAFYVFLRFRKTLAERFAEPSLERFADVSLGITTAFFLFAYAFPNQASLWFPRALLVPPLFGSLVLFLSSVQRYTHRTGRPVLFLIGLAAVVVIACNGSFHDVRTLPRVETAEGRLTVDDAVARWKAANNCTKTPCAARPIIVAIDGGASRAAFTAATFLGEMLDRMPAAGSGEAATPGRRIFAVSGVSGGAYGAAVLQAALADPQEGTGPAAQAPCHTAHRTWFGYRYRGSDDTTFNWHDCLQALTSGDYLSPTIVGLAFRDSIQLPFIEDRAALLEQSWERHFDYTVTLDPAFYGIGASCAVDASMELCRRMAHPRAFLDKEPVGNRWVPLLLLNGTSVETGRRIVSADFRSVRASGTDAGTLYGQAYDLGEAMSSQCPDVPPQPTVRVAKTIKARSYRVPGTRAIGATLATASKSEQTLRANTHGTCADRVTPLDGPDVRLSTAALTSARFPLISPAGTIRMKASAKDDGLIFGDHVVDGGYFENSGLTTALDIIAKLPKDLKPILVSISNDPEADKLIAGLPRRPAETPLVLNADDGPGFRVFGLIEGPLSALSATRDGHADEAEGMAEAALPGAFYRLTVAQTPDLNPAKPILPYDQGRLLRRLEGGLGAWPAGDDQGLDELVAVGVRTGRSRRATLRHRQPGNDRRHPEGTAAARRRRDEPRASHPSVSALSAQRSKVYLP